MYSSKYAPKPANASPPPAESQPATQTQTVVTPVPELAPSTEVAPPVTSSVSAHKIADLLHQTNTHIDWVVIRNGPFNRRIRADQATRRPL
jgi:hypothetical protein